MTWVPRLGAIRGTSSSSRISSGRMRSAQTPVALTTFAAPTSNSLAAVGVRAEDAGGLAVVLEISSTTSAPFKNTAPKRSASPSTVSTSRASSVWQS